MADRGPRPESRNSQAWLQSSVFSFLSGFGLRNSDLGGWRRLVLSSYARTAGGGHCNLDQAAAVSILAVATVGWREVGRLDRIGARAEGGRPGCRARVLACRGCRDRGQEGTK